jgi:hypothetical protein
VYFGLGVGSNFTGTGNQWSGAFDMSVAGAVNVMATLSATWQITGVQLEKGSTATPFEFRSIGTELGLCQRYYEKLIITPNYNGNGGTWTTYLMLTYGLRVTKRVFPTVTSANCVYYSSGANVSFVPNILIANPDYISVGSTSLTNAGGFTSGDIFISAEL